MEAFPQVQSASRMRSSSLLSFGWGMRCYYFVVLSKLYFVGFWSSRFLSAGVIQYRIAQRISQDKFARLFARATMPSHPRVVLELSLAPAFPPSRRQTSK